jgi:uncharacterized protein YlxW (UPF0749 family)
MMVVLIVAMVMIAGVVKARYGAHHRGRRGNHVAGQDDAETRQLREEVKVLRERLQVLERITVEKENSLEREIEALRDR